MSAPMYGAPQTGPFIRAVTFACSKLLSVAIISLFLSIMLHGWTPRLDVRKWTRSFRFKYAVGFLTLTTGEKGQLILLFQFEK